MIKNNKAKNTDFFFKNIKSRKPVREAVEQLVK